MIVLDTNVLSEVMRKDASEKVLDWLASQAQAALFTTAVTEAEIYYGLALLPAGKRRRALEDAAGQLFAEFAGRILPFDSAAAREFATLVAARRRAGRSTSVTDAEIAAIARSRGAKVATRDVEDFTESGVEVIDPWSGVPAT